MLAPMVLAKPERWARYATISLVCSVLGALVGYALGHYAFDFVRPLLADLGWLPRIDEYVAMLQQGCAAASVERVLGAGRWPASCRCR